MSSERERDAIDLLGRLYGRKADTPLYDAGMVEEWMDGEIAAFIRKYGSFPDQQRVIRDEQLQGMRGGVA